MHPLPLPKIQYEDLCMYTGSSQHYYIQHVLKLSAGEVWPESHAHAEKWKHK